MKISGQLVSSKPISLARAAKKLNDFVAHENGSSPVVALYLNRAADAINELVQFHKLLKNDDVESSPGRERARKSETESLENNPGDIPAKDSKNRRRKDKRIAYEAAEANPNEDEVQSLSLKSEEKEQKIPDEENAKSSKRRRGKKGKEAEAVKEAAAESNPKKEEVQNLKTPKVEEVQNLKNPKEEEVQYLKNPKEEEVPFLKNEEGKAEKKKKKKKRKSEDS